MHDDAGDELRISGRVWHVGDGACQYGQGRGAATARRYREDAPDGLKFIGRIVMVGHQVDQAAVEPKHDAICASHSVTALAAMASKTGWTSVGELAMRRRMSLVAACCARASVSSPACRQLLHALGLAPFQGHIVLALTG